MPARRYIVQFDLPSFGESDVGSVMEKLREVGVELDPSYRPVCINPKLQRYVVRGMAGDDARAAAERLGAVQFFVDAPVSAAAQKAGFGPAV